MDRYNLLRREREPPQFSTMTAAVPATSSSPPPQPLPSAGPSPPILSDWTLRYPSSSSRGRGLNNEGGTVFVGGTLSGGGGKIWFPLLRMGKLVDDPFDDNDSSQFDEVLSYSSGGYVEAVGGRIYELGRYVPPSGNTDGDVSGSGNEINNNNNNNNNNNKSLWGNGNNDPLVSWPFVSEGIFSAASAFVATVLLSGYLGFGLGAGNTAAMISSQSSTTFGSSSLSPPVTVVVTKSLATKQASSSPSAVLRVEQTLSEKRARQEVRVYREERAITFMTERLVSDQDRLKELRAEELAGTSGDTTGVEELKVVADRMGAKVADEVQQQQLQQQQQ